MNATRRIAGITQVYRGPRSNRFGLTAGWLIVGLAVASLLVGFIWSDSLVQYPGAERLALARLRLDFLPTGTISQYGDYQTADELPQVVGWYAQNFGLGHDKAQGDNCVTMSREDSHAFLKHSLAVTICSHTQRTLVFVVRSLAANW